MTFSSKDIEVGQVSGIGMKEEEVFDSFAQEEALHGVFQLSCITLTVFRQKAHKAKCGSRGHRQLHQAARSTSAQAWHVSVNVGTGLSRMFGVYMQQLADANLWKHQHVRHSRTSGGGPLPSWPATYAPPAVHTHKSFSSCLPSNTKHCWHTYGQEQNQCNQQPCSTWIWHVQLYCSPAYNCCSPAYSATCDLECVPHVITMLSKLSVFCFSRGLKWMHSFGCGNITM